MGKADPADEIEMTPSRSRGIGKGPAIVLGITTSVTLYAIFYSHFQQVRDKAVMRAGVDRDKERMRAKRQAAARDGTSGEKQR